MRLVSLECPNCGAPFDPPKDRNYCFCRNCGTKMLIDDGTVYVNIHKTEEKVTRIIDEAKIEKHIQRRMFRSELIDSIGLMITVILCLLLGVFAYFVTRT